MRRVLATLATVLLAPPLGSARGGEGLPKVPEGWRVERVVEAPAIAYPTALVAGPDGALYLGQDPMDMPGPPTRPIDSVVRIKGGRVTPFAEGLWAVMGLEWVDDALIVVHAPFLSAFRDTDGDGKADRRVDLMTGLGPPLPGFNGINDHVASGVRLGMDGFLYISVGDKGIPKGVGRDGTTIRLFGGGVIRIRPDGSGLEVVSTGERNPLSVALTTTDEVFTYGNDDDSKQWPNSLTHHIVGGHYGYPYQFLDHPARALPILTGQIGGSGTQGLCYNEDGLPPRYRGSFFFCDWGRQTITRYVLERAGGTFRVASSETFMEKGDVPGFRPYTIAPSADGASLYVVDWAFNGWLAPGPKSGRLYRLTYHGPDAVKPAPRPAGNDLASLVDALDHPAHSVRLAAQRALTKARAVEPLHARLRRNEPRAGRLHAIWALDAMDDKDARTVIRSYLADEDPEVRLQAIRCCGIRRDSLAAIDVGASLEHPEAQVRREAAIALGRVGGPRATDALLVALKETDVFAAWSVRQALRTIGVPDNDSLVAALLDEDRRENALKLCDENWTITVAEALAAAIPKTEEARFRARLVATIAGLARTYPAWSGRWFGTNPLAGDMPRKTEPWDPAGMRAVATALDKAIDDEDARVRVQAIVGLRGLGIEAAPRLRERLARETVGEALQTLAEGLGDLGDRAAAPALTALALDGGKAFAARTAALDALTKLPTPEALRGRLEVAFDPKAPPALVARALVPLARAGVVPPVNLASFLDRPEPAVRVAALQGIASKPAGATDAVRARVVARLDDPSEAVRRAAIVATAHVQAREALPRLIELAGTSQHRTEATLALAVLPDPRSIPIFVDALADPNPDLRYAAQVALAPLRDRAAGPIQDAAKSGNLRGPALLAAERVLATFRPVTDWKVIAPFPRTTARLFLGEPSIDFARAYPGAEGRPIRWQAVPADARSGRVALDAFKGGLGDKGGFGYDANGSPDLCAFGFAEVESSKDRPATLLVGSSGTVIVELNGAIVHHVQAGAGRRFTPDSDVVRVHLKAGRNRLLVQARQGIGAWCFGVQVSEPSSIVLAGTSGPSRRDEVRSFALAHEGDPVKGAAIFFDPKGVGCVKCHAAAGRGTATVGPDLTGLASKYDRAEIIRSVLEPSARLATGYQPVVIATADGRVLNGLVRSESGTSLEIVDSEAKVERIAKADVVERRNGDVSVMPAGVAESLEPEAFADLVAFLASLKGGPASK